MGSPRALAPLPLLVRGVGLLANSSRQLIVPFPERGVSKENGSKMGGRVGAGRGANGFNMGVAVETRWAVRTNPGGEDRRKVKAQLQLHCFCP